MFGPMKAVVAKKLGTKSRGHANRRLSVDELVSLAEKMVAAKDPDKAQRLKRRFINGFYGKHA